MKILELRFKNLNSLYGEWNINFKSPEYSASGIFAIIGNTGAGKSTILDAICLALYGSTPRLGRITKNNNEILSRHTKECYAEVLFETQSGIFRCNWNQHRAHGAIDGNLVDAKHEISDGTNDTILESKRQDVLRVIEEKTGMNFERFTRSMLLSQGNFAAFLQATPDERSPILEQITGTEIYSEISKRVHERNREERKTLEVLQAETAGITILSKEQKTALSETLVKQQTLEARKSVTQEKLQQSIQLRKQQASDNAALEHDKTQLPQLTQTYDEKKEALDTAVAALFRAKSTQKIALDMIKRVRALDLRITEKQATLQTAKNDYQTNEQERAKHQEQREKIVATQQKNLQDLEQVQTYLSDQAHDEALVTELAGIAERTKQFQSIANDSAAKTTRITQQKQQVQNALQHHETQKTCLDALQEEYKTVHTQVEHAKNILKAHLDGRLLHEYRTNRDTLMKEMTYLNKISSLESERKKLKDDIPCPLCGSKQHPFATAHMPETDEIQQGIDDLTKCIETAEHMEHTIKTQEHKASSIQSTVTKAEKSLYQAEHTHNEHQNTLFRLESELQDMTEQLSMRKNTILSQVHAFGITESELSNDTVSVVLSVLETRQKLWLEYQDKKTTLEKQHRELDAHIKQHDGSIDTITTLLQEQGRTVMLLTQEYHQLEHDRKELYDTKDPNIEEAKLESQIDEMERAERTAKEHYDYNKQQVADIQTRIATLQKTMENRHAELASLEKDGMERLHKNGITDAPLAILEKEYQDTKEHLQNITQEIGAIQQQLSNDKEATTKYQEKQALITVQQQECDRWGALHKLIGSADGKIYRNFAQGLTFEVMVSHANKQLEKITDRYLLVRNNDSLELNVIDTYQAGEERSTKNLSGGESFIVSLALALGLSKMASRKVRVDSLFLDEGFGTLDENALETALDALAGLQQDGKLIGIISHVPALQERIDTQIRVSPTSGGKSVIEGPGVSRPPLQG